MACLGVEPGAAVWKVQTNPLSYGGTPNIGSLSIRFYNIGCCSFSSVFITKIKIFLSGGNEPIWQYDSAPIKVQLRDVRRGRRNHLTLLKISISNRQVKQTSRH